VGEVFLPWEDDPLHMLEGNVYRGKKFRRTNAHAMRVYFFGRLPLERGYQVLDKDLVIRESWGGNNDSRYTFLPPGTEVYYLPTRGMGGHLLWASVLPKLLDP
jgi:hypothetical protein